MRNYAIKVTVKNKIQGEALNRCQRYTWKST